MSIDGNCTIIKTVNSNWYLHVALIYVDDAVLGKYFELSTNSVFYFVELRATRSYTVFVKERNDF